MAQPDAQTAALHRLLADATSGAEAKVDALVALAMRTVHLVPWPGGVEGYRTLVNSDGVAALPIFTTATTLELAARRYGWLDPDGNAAAMEIGARAALNYAIQKQLDYAVIDIANEHALEITRAEFEPLMTPAARRESTGPFALRGKVSSSLIRAVRSTPSPIQAVDGQLRPTPPPGSLAAPRVPAVDPPAATSTSNPGSPAPRSATSTPSMGPPVIAGPSTRYAPPSFLEDDAYSRLGAALRDFPEVEWAAMVTATGHGGTGLCAGVRVDPSYRQRVGEIASALRQAAVRHGTMLDVLLLDSPDAMKAARAAGEVFYPWRKS